MNKETKTMAIYKVLKRRGSINSLEAIKFGGTRVAARIGDLKKKGAVITSDPEKWNGILSARWTLVQGLEGNRS